MRPENPFTWASGWKSPIYCDNRLILSYPEIRAYIRDEMGNQLLSSYGKPDLLAGVATGAIGIGMLVAESLGLPFVYVRPEAKAHGRENQIEGRLEVGSTVVVIEDLISTGKSSLNAVAALEENGAAVQGMMAIFSYGFETALSNFRERGVSLHTLCDYEQLLEVARESGYIEKEQIKLLLAWRKDPAHWHP